ncbi:MAG: metallophosphoesterase [Deltaproteobacteria bacterium]|nr:metallophosphoesterase [Deltaproteobacteria bacterium]
MRIAHLSDIHVLSLEGERPWSFLNQRVLGGANLLFNRGGAYPVEVAEALVHDVNAQEVDHVIVSGDLTNLSLKAEFKRVAEMLGRLKGAPANVTVVPGNHDCYTLGAFLSRPFERVLAPFLESDVVGRQAFPVLKLRGDVAVIGLSSATFAPPLLATGCVGQRQLGALEQLLERPEVRRRFRIIVVHHPPRSPYASWHKRLVDGEALMGVIERAGADLVLHGHLHRELRDELPTPTGQALVVGVNSGTWVTAESPRRASYNLYEVRDGVLWDVHRRGYDVETKVYQDIIV